MTPENVLAAVDLGASSGRVMVGRVGPRMLELEEVHRFSNDPVHAGERLYWDILRLHFETIQGLRTAARQHEVASIGIDSWAVDYGLLDGDGELLGNVAHYRDARTDGVMEKVLADVPVDELYAVTGLQQLPFNTIYQLVASLGSPQLRAANTLLMVPDLLAYWLTGARSVEVTNASTTQLFDVRAGTWSETLIDRLGLPRGLFPPLHQPGDVVGCLRPTVTRETGLGPDVPVIAVGSHDTASSVVGVPGVGERFAYLSCGTWSLVGLELDEPVLSAESRIANFTNERGVDGKIRYLRNVMGLWLLQQSLSQWAQDGRQVELGTVLERAARVPPFTCLVNPDEYSFLAPGDMPRRITDYCRATGQTPPRDQAEVVRCILDSLALAYRRTLREAQHLADREVDTLHVVGGGARNALLCQLTADACGVPVLAGPVEATALGNVLVQARSLGRGPNSLQEMRTLIRRTHQLASYQPRGDNGGWVAAERRVESYRSQRATA